MIDLQAEMKFARAKFPAPDGLVSALVEEFSEFAEAVINKDDDSWRKEVLQIACVAMRIYEEGDPLRHHGATHRLLEDIVPFEDRARAVLRETVSEAAAAKSP